MVPSVRDEHMPQTGPHTKETVQHAYPALQPWRAHTVALVTNQRQRGRGSDALAARPCGQRPRVLLSLSEKNWTSRRGSGGAC
jgi:hypothetical protein